MEVPVVPALFRTFNVPAVTIPFLGNPLVTTSASAAEEGAGVLVGFGLGDGVGVLVGAAVGTVPVVNTWAALTYPCTLVPSKLAVTKYQPLLPWEMATLSPLDKNTVFPFTSTLGYSVDGPVLTNKVLAVTVPDTAALAFIRNPNPIAITSNSTPTKIVMYFFEIDFLFFIVPQFSRSGTLFLTVGFLGRLRPYI